MGIEVEYLLRTSKAHQLPFITRKPETNPRELLSNYVSEPFEDSFQKICVQQSFYEISIRVHGKAKIKSQ